MPLKAMEVTMIRQRSSRSAIGMEDDAQAGHERADDREADAGEHGLDGAGHVEAEDQLELGDGSYQIALVDAAGLVVDV